MYSAKCTIFWISDIQCQNEDKCKYWTKESKRCLLKSDKTGEEKSKEGYTSGSRGCAGNLF